MQILLEAKNLSKKYVKTTGFFTRKQTVIKALDNISVSIKRELLWQLLVNLEVENLP